MAAPESKSLHRRVRENDMPQDLGHAITQTNRAYQKALNAELAPHGLTVRQSQVLGWLRKKGNLSPCQLASLLRIKPHTLSGVLERMERDGLIRRNADRSDRRQKLICLNPCAEELGATAVECSARVCARAVQGLSPKEIDVLRELLKGIVETLASIEKNERNGRVK
jgi:MarR family transcriptional regulator, transcriptional regulator for hemolysin